MKRQEQTIQKKRLEIKKDTIKVLTTPQLPEVVGGVCCVPATTRTCPDGCR